MATRQAAQEITTHFAIEDDIPHLVDMAEELYDQANYKGWFSHEKVTRLLYDSYEKPEVFLLVATVDGEYVGYFFGGIGEMIFCEELAAVDVSFYVRPEYRGWIAIRMLKVFKEWAKRMGAKTIGLGISTEINSERTQKLYERMGFKVIGSQHRMEV